MSYIQRMKREAALRRGVNQQVFEEHSASVDQKRQLGLPLLPVLAAMTRPQLAQLCLEWGHSDPDMLDRGDLLAWLLLEREATALGQHNRPFQRCASPSISPANLRAHRSTSPSSPRALKKAHTSNALKDPLDRQASLAPDPEQDLLRRGKSCFAEGAANQFLLPSAAGLIRRNSHPTFCGPPACASPLDSPRGVPTVGTVAMQPRSTPGTAKAGPPPPTGGGDDGGVLLGGRPSQDRLLADYDAPSIVVDAPRSLQHHSSVSSISSISTLPAADRSRAPGPNPLLVRPCPAGMRRQPAARHGGCHRGPGSRESTPSLPSPTLAVLPDVAMFAGVPEVRVTHARTPRTRGADGQRRRAAGQLARVWHGYAARERLRRARAAVRIQRVVRGRRSRNEVALRHRPAPPVADAGGAAAPPAPPEQYERRLSERVKELQEVSNDLRQLVATTGGPRWVRSGKGAAVNVVASVHRVFIPARLDELTPDDMVKLEQTFVAMDEDGSGTLDFLELRDLWWSVFGTLTETEVDRITGFMFEDVDADGDHEVTWRELANYLTGKFDCPETAEIAKVVGMPSFVKFNKPLTWRHWIWALVEATAVEHYRCQWLRYASTAIAIFLQFVIALATVAVVIDSVRDLDPGVRSTFNVIESTCIALFTTEFLLRWGVCTLREPGDTRILLSQRLFWSQLFTYIDLVAILPFYLQKAGVIGTGDDDRANNMSFVRMVRLVRVVRIMRMLKLGRNSEGFQLLLVAMSRARTGFMWMGMLLALTTVLFGAFAFYAEIDECTYDATRGGWVRWDNSSLPDAGRAIEFQSIIPAMWWAIGTLTSCAYGEIIPHTGTGQTVAGATMVVGLLVTAYPITIITVVFSDVWEQYKQGLARKNRRKQLFQDGYRTSEAYNQQQQHEQKVFDGYVEQTLARRESRTSSMLCTEDSKDAKDACNSSVGAPPHSLPAP